MLLAACSAKKDAFLNRSFHSVTTKYNVLYNGQVAFDQEKQQIDDSYNDNFWERLPIEPLKIVEQEITIPDLPTAQTGDEDEKIVLEGFEKAEQKAKREHSAGHPSEILLVRARGHTSCAPTSRRLLGSVGQRLWVESVCSN